MTLPVAPAARRGPRSAWSLIAALFLLVTGWLAAVPVRAADDDPYAATVKVDSAADNSAKARELARLDGERRALAEVADKLGGPGAAAKLPKLDDNAITNLVVSFEVANERMSAVRYLADMTFHFRPAEIQKVLRTAGIALNPNPAAPPAAPGTPGAAAANPAEQNSPAKSTLVLPVYVAGGKALLWDDPNPWRTAWTDRPVDKGADKAGDKSAEKGKTPLSVPLGDIGDVGAIDAEKARSANAEALNAIAKRNGAEDVLVMIATALGPPDHPTGLDVTVRRYRQGKLNESHSLSVDASPGENPAELFPRAVSAVVAAIDSNWKKEPGGRYDQQGSLTAAVSITGLDDWVQLRDRLTSLGTIRKIELMSLSRQEAVIDIQYSGTIEQLKASLADLHLDLVHGDPNWRIARAGTAAK